MSVSDNFGASEGFHYYRIVPHGLRPGAVVYTNRRYVWTVADGKDFPASLLNADVVQTGIRQTIGGLLIEAMRLEDESRR